MGVIDVVVVRAVPASVTAAQLKGMMVAAAGLPEISARLPSKAALTLRVTGDRELRRLNRRYLGDDHATDVLAFPSGDEGEYLGDVVVSWPAVERQAAEHGHEASAELALLAVHGLLHLLGWDHAAAVERDGRRVWVVKPQTWMNLSGQAVATAVRDLGLSPGDVWVVHDELDLPLCRLRIRVGGSGAGNNGVRSVIESLGTADFVRFRVGVGKPPNPAAG